MTRKNEQERFMSYITERQTHESRMAVADFLRKYADRYHNSDFISSDPVQFPHRYHFKADIEISAFLTAFLSFLCSMCCPGTGKLISVVRSRSIGRFQKIEWHNCFIGCILYMIGMRVWRMLFFAKRMELRCNVFVVCLECRIRRRKRN